MLYVGFLYTYVHRLFSQDNQLSVVYKMSRQGLVGTSIVLSIVRTIWSFYLLTPSGFIYIRQQDHQGRTRLLVTQTVQLMLAEMHLLFVIV